MSDRAIGKQKPLVWLRAKHEALLNLADEGKHEGHWVQTIYPAVGPTVDFMCACGAELSVDAESIVKSDTLKVEDMKDLEKHIGIDTSRHNQVLLAQCAALWTQVHRLVGEVSPDQASAQIRLAQVEGDIQREVTHTIEQMANAS